MEEKKYTKVPAFKPDTCKGCKGHGNFILDHEYEDADSRKLLSKVIDNYVGHTKKEI